MSWQSLEGVNFEEKMMWVGVLRRAVFDYVLYKGKKKHEMKWRRAHRFIFDDETDYGINLSFTEICGLFGWEPEYIQRKVKDLDRTDIRKLESTKFREDFKLDMMPTESIQTPKWEAAPVSAPFFTKFLYSKDYRGSFVLRPVPYLNAPTPPLLLLCGAAA